MRTGSKSITCNIDQKLKGGRADKKNPKDFDPSQLAKGMKVEREHTNDPAVTREIAMDHLAEDPHYYTKLLKARL